MVNGNEWVAGRFYFILVRGSYAPALPTLALGVKIQALRYTCSYFSFTQKRQSISYSGPLKINPEYPEFECSYFTFYKSGYVFN
jgi:hypothetical protein